MEDSRDKVKELNDQKEHFKMMATMMGLGISAAIGLYWINKKDKCWDAKEVAGVTIKINQCTGEVDKIDLQNIPKS